MPLSEEELRLLEQMERALSEEDPKFASTLRGTTLRRTARRRAMLGGAGFLVGIGILMAGAITEVPLLGVAGFVVMLAAATLGLTALRGQAASGAEPQPAPRSSRGFTVIDGGRKRGRSTSSAGRASGSMMDRFEQRWRRRRERGGGF